MPQRLALLILLSSLLLLCACESRQEQAAAPAQPAADQASTPPATPTPSTAPDGKTVPADQASGGPADRAAGGATAKEPAPPSPPISENFEGAPQLSLFARIGAFRPEDTDSKDLSFWKTYLDHALRTSGAVAGAGRGGGRAWAIRSIKGLKSIGFFSPLAVQPKTTYEVRFAFKGTLPEGASAGVGILEFDRFLWIGEQFTASLTREHRIGTETALPLKGSEDWQEHTLTFTTSPETHMIHLVLFRDGPEARKPVLFDDLSITPVPAG